MRSERSSWVRRICAVCRPCSAKLDSQACTSPIWPMAAAACNSCIALGRAVQPRRLMPAATAPEETSTSSTPASCKATICSTHTPIAVRSSPLPSAVSSALPILTTQRCAPVTLLRILFNLCQRATRPSATHGVIRICILQTPKRRSNERRLGSWLGSDDNTAPCQINRLRGASPLLLNQSRT